MKVACCVLRGLPFSNEGWLLDLKSARARGRNGGRPKGMSQSAIEKAAIAEALYKNGSIPVKKIAEQLGISKTTLYLYLRYRNVDIGAKI